MRVSLLNSFGANKQKVHIPEFNNFKISHIWAPNVLFSYGGRDIQLVSKSESDLS